MQRQTSLLLLMIFGTFVQWSCNSSGSLALSNAHPVEPHSFANSQEAVTKHLDLDLKVDFESKKLTGIANWQIENKGASQIVLDINGLNIKKVLIGSGDTFHESEFKIGTEEPHLGQPLVIGIEPTTNSLSIHYETATDAAALLWIEPEQTLGKQLPFLFTQGQPVLTRSWIPCQDSPGVRVTYDAKVQVPPGLLAVMSASNPKQKSANGQYSFSMKYPIPPYLIAMAAGDLAFEQIGNKAGVYCEPALMDDALYEFDKVTDMMAAAEDMFGKYPWGRFDILVLPPSFPFGGMENPMLTFVTPTLITGDRSLTSTIAHELAHSWSGNLVTNATWDDFWLNEGTTVYIERRIIEAIEGRPFANMNAVIGKGDVERVVSSHSSEDTHLRLDLEGRNPDDGMTAIAYEKGAFLLETIEEQVGREAFDEFLNNYFSSHRFQTITTDQFLDFLNKNLLAKHPINFDVKEWTDGAGLPKSCREIKSVRFEIVDRVVEQVKAGQDVRGLGIDGWSAFEKLHFIRKLPNDLPSRTMKRLDYIYGLSNSTNSEIQAAWFTLSIYNAHAFEIMDRIEEFLIRVGRRKFLTPIYKAFVDRGQVATARKIYEKARGGYHSISRETIDEVLGL